MTITHLAMLAISVGVPGAAWLAHRIRIAAALGTLAWITTASYFIPEIVAVAYSRAPYSPLSHPMSVLGVTTCGTVPMADYPICSPLHPLMNWVFVINGVTASAAAILLHRYWPRSRKTAVATLLLVIFGLSNAATGVIPADLSLGRHTVVALPSMVTPIPALLLLASAASATMPGLARWTHGCVAVSGLATVSLVVQPFEGLAGGLLQRVLYAAVWLWGVGAGVALWRRVSS